MSKPIEFTNMVISDITRCETFFQNNQNAMQLFQELYGRYSKTSLNFPKIQDNPLLLQHHENVIEDNIRAIYGFLIAYKNNNYEDFQISIEKPLINISNTATNENSININITFEQARQQIEDMSALSEDDIKDIMDKIEKIEEITKSKEKKSKKWDNAKGIIKWVADKGVDVGKVLLPMLLKITE